MTEMNEKFFAAFQALNVRKEDSLGVLLVGDSSVTDHSLKSPESHLKAVQKAEQDTSTAHNNDDPKCLSQSGAFDNNNLLSPTSGSPTTQSSSLVSSKTETASMFSPKSQVSSLLSPPKKKTSSPTQPSNYRLNSSRVNMKEIASIMMQMRRKPPPTTAEVSEDEGLLQDLTTRNTQYNIKLGFEAYHHQDGLHTDQPQEKSTSRSSIKKVSFEESVLIICEEQLKYNTPSLVIPKPLQKDSSCASSPTSVTPRLELPF